MASTTKFHQAPFYAGHVSVGDRLPVWISVGARRVQAPSGSTYLSRDGIIVAQTQIGREAIGKLSSIQNQNGLFAIMSS
jgi:hypothetical protein